MGDQLHPSTQTRRTEVMLLLTLALAMVTRAYAGVSSRRPPVDAPCRPSMRLEVPLLAPMVNGSAWDPENGMLWPREAYFEVEGEREGKEEDPPEAYIVCPCNYAGSATRPCLRKCCPLDQAMDRSTLGCVPHKVATNEPWFNPPVMDDASGNSSVQGSAEGLGKHFFVFQSAEDDCEESGKIILNDEEFLVSSKDGSLITQNATKRDEPGSYCVDYFVGEDMYFPMLCYQEENTTAYLDEDTVDPEVVTMAANATDQERSTCERLIYVLYPIGMIISIVFLSLSLFVYASVCSLRNLHGKCLMCHMASLLTVYVFLTIVLVFGDYVDNNFCTASGFIVYFSFLSTFMWLNIMCIDMFIAFSGVLSMAGNDQERNRKKFVMYAAYSWGVPLIILIFTLIVEFGPVPDYLLKPDFYETCWFSNDSARVAYFIAPVGLILACNVVLFVLTALKIYKLKKETQVLKQGDSGRHQQEGDDNNQRFQLYLKLFIVMGVNWALEIISWIVGGECFWIPTDLLNTLQGLFVFLIFVWKVNIRRELAEKVCPWLAAKLKFMVPTSSVNSDRRTTASTASSNVANSSNEEGQFEMDCVSSKVFERNPSAESTTVT